MSYICVKAQNVISSAGDEFSNTNQSITWTLGELSTESYEAATNKFTQGFHQPVLIITALNDILLADELSIFPNPTAQNLSFRATGYEGGASIFVTNIIGMHVRKFELNDISQSIDVSTLPDGEYILSVIGENKQSLGKFKIIKKD